MILSNFRRRYKIIKNRLNWLFAKDMIKNDTNHIVVIDKIRNIDDIKDVLRVCVSEIRLTDKQARRIVNKSLIARKFIE